MKFYLASYSGSDSDGMIYRKHGRERDLYQLFPELREVINRYPFKTIDFRLANGDLVSFEESYNLCGQCHGTIFRDWKAGIHGKRTGEWNGRKQYRLCVHCHNPHSPRFKPIKPLPPPDKPLEIKYQKLSDEEIPRNPLGNMQ